MKTPHLAALLCAAATSAAAASEAEMIERGRYLATIMDCAGCHMQRGPDGAPIVEAGLSGGTIGFEIPGLGVFWPPNLTPHETGLGGWTVDQVKAAIHDGLRPDGRQLAPIMPYMAYAALPDEDLEALVAFLRAQPPVENKVPAPMSADGAAPLPFYKLVLPR